MAVHPVSNNDVVDDSRGAASDPIIVLDWDDTILPNTHLAILGFADESASFALSEESTKELEKLTDEIVAFLTVCVKLTRQVFIVTNGQHGWVQRSCRRFLPRVLPLLDHMTIISARSKYEAVYPRCPVEWKIATFSDVLCRPDDKDASPEFFSEVDGEHRQVIAFGDSPHDRSAIQYVGKRTPNLCVKSIKFLENPTMQQLQKQLTRMAGFLNQLCAHHEALDIVISAEMLRSVELMWLPRASGYDLSDEDQRHHHGSRHRRHKRSHIPQRLAPLDERHERRRGSRNQSDDEEDSRSYGGQRYYSEARYPPPMTVMCLPPLEFYEIDRRNHRHGKGHRRRRDEQRRRCRRDDSRSSSSESESDCEERIRRQPQVDLRSQRVRSLQAMAKLQRNAARVIQQEYRFYRNRCCNRKRQATQLHARACEFLDAFLKDDVLPHLVSEALLEALRDQAKLGNSTSISIGDGALATHAEGVYHELLHSVVSDVFQAVVDSMVREYMVSRLDMTRASQPPSSAVAGDIVDGLLAELAAEIVPEALTELVQDYISWRHRDDQWQALVQEQLQDIVVDTTVELVVESMLSRLQVGASNGYT